MQKIEVKELAFTEYMRLDDLIKRHHPKNPKDHDIGGIITSIEEFGFVRNVMLNEKDGLLLYGHGTTEALFRMMNGDYKIPVRIASDRDGMWLVPTDRGVKLTKKKAKAYVIADNRYAELGGWDEPRLVDNLIAIAGKTGKGLRGTGYDGDELDLLIRMYRPELIDEPEDPGAQIDKAAELQKKWKVKRGQVWEIGNHRLMCGDCTSEENVKRLMDGKKATMVFADPPYGQGLNTDYHSITKNWKSEITGHIKGKTYSEVIGDDKEFDPTFVLSFFTGIKEIFLWGADYYSKFLPLGGWFVWDKCVTKDGVVSEGAENMIGSVFELCWSKQRHKRLIVRLFHRGFTSVDHSERVHPTQKPIQLAEWFIERFSNLDNMIVDPYLGSGTTMVAAEQLNRICYGMEIEPKYCAVTLERMQGMGLDPRIVHA